MINETTTNTKYFSQRTKIDKQNIKNMVNSYNQVSSITIKLWTNILFLSSLTSYLSWLQLLSLLSSLSLCSLILSCLRCVPKHLSPIIFLADLSEYHCWVYLDNLSKHTTLIEMMLLHTYGSLKRFVSSMNILWKISSYACRILMIFLTLFIFSKLSKNCF